MISFLKWQNYKLGRQNSGYQGSLMEAERREVTKKSNMRDPNSDGIVCILIALVLISWL